MKEFLVPFTGKKKDILLKGGVNAKHGLGTDIVSSLNFEKGLDKIKKAAALPIYSKKKGSSEGVPSFIVLDYNAPGFIDIWLLCF